MSAIQTRSRVDRDACRREDVLPDPFSRCVGKFSVECIRHVDRSESMIKIFEMNEPYMPQMFLERFENSLRENCASIAIALCVPDDDLVMTEVEVFHAQACAFIQTETAPIEELEDESMTDRDSGDDLMDFLLGQDRW